MGVLQKLFLQFSFLGVIFMLSSCVNTFFDAIDPFTPTSPTKSYAKNKKISKNKPRRYKQPRSEVQSSEFAAFKREIFSRVNSERAKAGVPPLQSITVLKRIADIRSCEVAKYYSHNRPDGRIWSSILQEYGVRWTYCAENIAVGQRSPAEVMADWMSSQGHRANILNRQCKYIGIGVCRNAKGQLCWVQNFLTQ